MNRKSTIWVLKYKLYGNRFLTHNIASEHGYGGDYCNDDGSQMQSTANNKISFPLILCEAESEIKFHLNNKNIHDSKTYIITFCKISFEFASSLQMPGGNG